MAKTNQKRKTRIELDLETCERLGDVLDEAALDAALEGLEPSRSPGPAASSPSSPGRVISAALESEMEEHLGRPGFESR